MVDRRKGWIKNALFLGIIISIVLLVWALPKARAEVTQGKVCHKDHCFKVEVAQDVKDLMRGLQFRTSLADDAGMLFIFPMNAAHRFWMKDTLIPLDMIWINESQRIVYIAPKVPPCKSEQCPSYGPPAGEAGPPADARYVLEINAGLSVKLGIRMGDPLEFRL